MSRNLDRFVDHLRDEGYHPRSDKHSNVLSKAIVDDLLDACPHLARAAAAGEVVYDLNFTIASGTSDWNVDLVLGAPVPGTPPPEHGQAIRRLRPSTVHLAIEIKSVMTEHRKAVKNRTRDLEAHHEHVHRYNARTIAGGVLVVNQAATFRSPLRSGVTQHRKPKDLVAHCLLQVRSITSGTGPDSQGLDAKCALVVEMDNQDLRTTRLVTEPPAPPVGDPLNYHAFLQTLCTLYRDRFLT
ncbi:MAG: hypothetical protein AMS14_08910 [Planctomycetes bacterium DG_20]|nr:MAG: hypothetical protein AMS14_08910 [Planctomycetes bacterium DG_20]